MKRNKKQLTAAECSEVLQEAEYGTLATIGIDGSPYTVPVNYIYINGSIYFHCTATGHKLDNIAHCPNVAFNVVTDVKVIPPVSGRQTDNNAPEFNGLDTINSVTVFGKICEVFEKEKLDGLNALFKRFLNKNEYLQQKEACTRDIEKSLERIKLIKIDIEHMAGKRGIKESRKISRKQ